MFREVTNGSTVNDVFTHLTEDGGEGDWAIALFRRSVTFLKIS